MKLEYKRFSKNRRKFAILAALLVLQVAPPPASFSKDTISISKTLYAPDVDISPVANFGPNLRGSRDVQQYGTLIAIGGDYVRGKAAAQINRLLSGEPSTTVECTFLDQNEIKKVSLSRTKVVQQNGNPFENSIVGLPISSRLDLYPGTYRRYTIADALNHDFGSCPEIAAAAAERTKIEQIRALPLLSPWLLSVNLAKATTAYDRLGDRKAAQKCIDLLNASGYFSSSQITGMQFQNQIESQFTSLIQDFMETGRYELLCKIFTQMKNDAAENVRPYPQFYFDALTCRGDLSVSERADLLKFAKETLATQGIINAHNLCDDLERVGEYTTAAALYSKMLDQNKGQLANENEYKNGNFNIAEVARFAYKLAEAQQKSNDLKAAIATTTDMLSKYDSLVPARLQLIDEQLDMRFPRRSDLELQLANFQHQNNEPDEAEKYATLAINRIHQAVGEHNSSLRGPYELMHKIALKKKDNVVAAECLERLKHLDTVAVEHISNAQAEYALVQTATTAIDENKLPRALKAIQALLSIYKNNEQDRIAVLESLNLLSALTIQARALADHGHLDESNNLLTELNATFKKQNPPNSVCLEPDLEMLLNKELREKTVGKTGRAGIWHRNFPATCLIQRDLIPKFMVLRNDVMVPMQQQEILREQAIAYEFAGDLRRANMIVDHALAYCKLEPINSDDSGKLSNKVVSVLLLDKARLLAKNNAFEEAQSLANDALKKYGEFESATYPLSNKTPYDASRIATFEKLIRNKTVALARVLIDHNNLQNAGQLLETLQSQIEPNQGQSSWVFQGPDSENAGYEWMVAANIADIYFRQHAMTKANMWLDKALTQTTQRPSQGLLILAATIAVADGDHKKAATFYKKAADCGDFCPIFAYRDEYRNALLKASKSEGAYTCNSQKDESIDASISLAKQLENSGKSAAAALEAYKKIWPMLSESDKRRLDIRQSILSLERNLAWNETLKKILAEKDPNAPAKKMTPVEEEKQKVANALAEILDLKELAQIAEETHSDKAWVYWLGLANSEVIAKDPKRAAIYAYKFFKTCPPEKMKSLFPIFDSVPIAIAVSNQQNNNDGEGIVCAHMASFGAPLSKWFDLSLQSELLAYYVGTGRFNEAKEFMPKLLAGSGLAIGDNWHSGSAFGRISSFDSDKLSHAQNISLARESIEIEKKELPIDAHALSTMLDQLAANEAKWGMTQQAIRDYLESERIDEKYVGCESAPSYEYRLKPLLLKTGDTGRN